MTNALLLIASLCIGVVIGQLDWRRSNKLTEAHRTSPEWVRIERQLQSLQASVDAVEKGVMRIEREQHKLRAQIDDLAKQLFELEIRVNGMPTS